MDHHVYLCLQSNQFHLKMIMFTVYLCLQSNQFHLKMIMFTVYLCLQSKQFHLKMIMFTVYLCLQTCFVWRFPCLDYDVDSWLVFTDCLFRLKVSMFRWWMLTIYLCLQIACFVWRFPCLDDHINSLLVFPDRLFRLKMFSDEQGSWFIMFLISLITIFIMSCFYNLFLLIGGDSTLDWRISDLMGVSNDFFMKVPNF